METNKKNLMLFITSFLVPLVYYRLFFFVIAPPQEIYLSPLRKIIGLNVHHLHYGLILLTISILLLLFYKRNIFSTILAGLGLGLSLDVFIPSLFVKTIRENELLVYSQHLTDTLILFFIVIAMALGVYILERKILTKKRKQK